ncbi:hypothetical protein SLE2022_158240 [Rubroshorea leprosula]
MSLIHRSNSMEPSFVFLFGSWAVTCSLRIWNYSWLNWNWKDLADIHRHHSIYTVSSNFLKKSVVFLEKLKLN